MNAAKIAMALHALADAILDEEDGAIPAPPKSKSARRPRGLTRPAGQVSDIASAHAARVLREKGVI